MFQGFKNLIQIVLQRDYFNLHLYPKGFATQTLLIKNVQFHGMKRKTGSGFEDFRSRLSISLYQETRYETRPTTKCLKSTSISYTWYYNLLSFKKSVFVTIFTYFEVLISNLISEALILDIFFKKIIFKVHF